MSSVKVQKTFLDFFPVPKFLMISSAGIAVTDKNVKFVEFKEGKVKRGLELSHCGEVNLPAGTVAGGRVEDKQALAKALSELSTRYGVRYARAVLPEERAYLFTATIDHVPFAGLRDAVAFIIEENAPVVLAESVFDFDIVGQTADKIEVLVSVLPREVVEFFTKVFESAGITVISYDIESQAVARAVVPVGDKRTHLIINLGEDKTGFYVVEDEVVQFSSTSSYGVTSGSSHAGVSDLKTELRKLFAFWETRADKRGEVVRPIARILICGSEAGRGDFVTELMKGVEVEHKLANVWINAFSLQYKVPEVPFSESLGYAAAVGLALPRETKPYV